ncbi:hypothetical protein FO488_11550 [Geobacter sp. FeAm09]|uniref:sensor histidine kinase n=1 Tax=Geobacter sp. FeAm09 TaxID=2597769 RepID=UPI0011EEE5D3|nr:ATP-binding protein [Geobacter sp. FeAm09]QEM68726.1 hypothetical protein FO488_11550 [Geobacter sp. FeAm09]
MMVIIMTLSVGFQFLAAFLALRLIRVSGEKAAWMLVAGGLIVMGIRRLVMFVHILAGYSRWDVTVEMLGLVISIMMTCGILLIKPLFLRYNQVQEELRQQRAQLELANRNQEERIAAAVAELRRKDEVLIRQNRFAAMGEMITNIAHQWRQPLNSIGLIVQNLNLGYQSGTLSPAQFQEDVASAMTTIERMSLKIDELRTFFLKDTVKRGFHVDKAVAQTLGLLDAALQHARIRVDMQAETGVTLVGYRNEYARAVLNIVSNARDVLLERKVEAPCIAIRIFRENDRCVVTVRDNGGGIDEAIIPRIFDPYFTTKEPHKGTGIGLYLSKVIIENSMGGSISACNVAGGAEFRIVA